MFFPVKQPLPLITSRVEFKFNKFPSLPPITLRQSHEKSLRTIRRSRTPYARTRTLHRQLSSSDEEDPTERTTSESPESEDETLVAKIPKPPGEAGRKNSGGFNLQDELGWNDDKYKEFTVSYSFPLMTSTY